MITQARELGFAILAFSISSCSSTAPVPELPASVSEAAEMCYIASLQQLRAEFGLGYPDDQFLQSVYFSSKAVVSSKAPSVPTLEEYAKFANAPAVSAKYKDVDLRVRNADCAARFPESRSDYPVNLPLDENERAALCFYTSGWVKSLIKGSEVKPTQITQKAISVSSSIGSNSALMNRLVAHYGMHSAADGDRLRAKTLASSVKYGNYATITKACSSMSWDE